LWPQPFGMLKGLGFASIKAAERQGKWIEEGRLRIED